MYEDPYQSAGNPYEDRITKILQSRAQPQEITPYQNNAATNAAVYSALGGRSQGVEQILEAMVTKPRREQQDREFESAKGLYDLFEEKRARGDKQAQALFDRISMFTGGDPEGTAMFVEALHRDPEKIDPGNAFQVMSKLAGIAKTTGYKPLDIRLKEAQIRASDALTKQRKEGGSGGGNNVTTFVYNKTVKALENAGVTVTPSMELQILSAARNGLPKGSTITVNGQEVSIENIIGVENALAAQEEAKKSGGSFGDLQGKAIFDLPRVRSTASEAITAIDNALNSDGLKNITGWLSIVPVTPGGERARAEALLDQIGGRAFLAAYETLKGGGQITEVEGRKGEQALATLASSQSYDDVVRGLQDMRGVITRSVQAKEKQASQSREEITSETFSPPVFDDIGVEDMTDEDILGRLQ